ncbi:MAG: hypothetical protein M3R59_03260 [Verrucomicrobiota bacterium]|nr:hypothetical protein [Verrucomicrobiota bacterium]
MNEARAKTFMEFLKDLGNSIAHPQTKEHPKPTPSRKRTNRSSEPLPAVSTTPMPTAPPLPVRVALAAPTTKGVRHDYPFGVAVPGRPGYVTSPYAPNEGIVDVRGFPSGAEVKDPFTGKVFLIP